MLHVLAALEEVEKQVLLCEFEDGEDEMFNLEHWVDTEIEVTLDSGCCEHVLDLSDAPGYNAFLTELAGSNRGQSFVVGNTQWMPDEGYIQLNMECGNFPLQSVFQVAGVTRPLMSVGRVCDQGLKCIFDDKKALVVDKDSEGVCRFERRGGLYVARLKLNNPEVFPGPAR